MHLFPGKSAMRSFISLEMSNMKSISVLSPWLVARVGGHCWSKKTRCSFLIRTIWLQWSKLQKFKTKQKTTTKKKPKTPQPNQNQKKPLEDQNVVGNLTAVFTASKVTSRMTVSFAHPFFRQEKARGSYSLFQWTSTIYCTTLKIIIITQTFKFTS